MWKISKQKIKPETLKPLNEKEIQKKLYGRYHAEKQNELSFGEDIPTPAKSEATLKTTPVQKPEVFHDDLNQALNRESAGIEPHEDHQPVQFNRNVQQEQAPVVFQNTRSSLLPQSDRSKSWFPDEQSNQLISLIKNRNAMLAAGFIVAVLVGFGMFVNSQSKAEPKIEKVSIKTPEIVIPIKRAEKSIAYESSKVKEKTSYAPVKNIVQPKPIEKVNAEPESLVPQTEKIAPVVVPAPEIVFSIQICTYFTEIEANRLVERLESIGLPAYYKASESPSHASSSKLYYVLVGKDKSFSEAQLRMAQFKKMQISKEFSDSYVRRIS